MARVRTFEIDKEWSVPDKEIANFITDCETSHYVNVTTHFVPWPTPRLTVIVTKLDVKDEADSEDEEPRSTTPRTDVRGPKFVD